MLKKMSLPADEETDDGGGAHSESRMLRALEALSSQPQPDLPPEMAPQPSVGEPGMFRGSKPAAAREPFRADSAYHASKGRHRFVRDGEVPVVHVSANRPAAPAVTGRGDADWARLQQQHDEQKLRAEQAERGRAEAQTQIKTLQTKLAHAELSLTDAQTLLQTRQQELQALREELTTARPAPAARAPLPDGVVKRGPGRPRKIVTAVALMTPASAHSSAGPDMLRPQPGGADQPEAEPVVKRGPGRPRKYPLVTGAAAPDPQPVEWWLMPSKTKRRG